MRQFVRGALTVGLTTALALGTTSVAHAESGPSSPSATQTATAIADIVPGIAAQTTGATVHHDAHSGAVTTTNGSTVDIPRDPAAPIVLDNPAAPQVGVTIDGAASAKDAKRTSNGMVVYQGTDTATSTAVQATNDGGVRFMTAIDAPTAPSDYRFHMDLPAGAHLVAAGAGGFIITNGDGSPFEAIDAPWAKDANGVSLPVSYSLDGTTIVMHVDLAGAVYPVVADPAVHFTWGWTSGSVYFSVTRTREIQAQLNTSAVGWATNLNSAALCGAIAVGSGLAGVITGPVCGVIYHLGLWRFQNSVNDAVRAGGCLRISFGTRVSIGTTPRNNSNCSFR